MAKTRNFKAEVQGPVNLDRAVNYFILSDPI